MISCKDCKKRDTCTSLCREAEAYVSQDNVKQKDLTVANITIGDKMNIIEKPRELSLREKQVFFLWAGGMDRGEICQALKISRQNLKKQLQSINKKIPSTQK